MPGTIITIAQQKGGSGKTTLAAHLAVALLRHKLPVAILDIDPQGSLGSWFEKREERFGEDHVGIAFRTASGWGAKRESRHLARDHGFVIVDTPPKSDTEARSAIEGAAIVTIPVQPTPMDLWATETTLAMLDRAGIAGLLVMNRVPARANLTNEVEEALSAFGPKVATSRIGNRVGFAASMGIGSTVLEDDPEGKSAEEVMALVREIRRRAPAPE